MRRSRHVRLLAVLALLATAGAAVAQPAIEIEWNDDRLAVVAHAASLPDLLEALARETGITVWGLANLDRTAVSISFTRLTLREGLERILAGQDYALIEEASPGESATPVAVVLAGWRGAASGSRSGDAAQRRAKLEIEGAGPFTRDLADRDPAVRTSAVARLSGRSDPETFARLVAALHDVEAEVRQAALAALASFGPTATEAVSGLVRREPVPAVRADALRLLGQIARREAAPVLRGMLEDPDPGVRIAAVEAAGHSDGALGRETLIRAARDGEPGVRMAALRTLAFYARDDDARAILRQALVDPDATVRALAKGLLEVTRD